MSESTARRRGLPERVKMRHDTHFVEELATGRRDPVGAMVPLSSIEPDPMQPRSTMGELGELASSIRDKGVLEPILIRPLGSASSERFRIISGERRYHAAADAGLVEVPAIIMEVGEDEALEIALVENLQRKDLTPFEEAEGYRALGERHGYTHERIAEAVGKSRSLVTETLTLLHLGPRVREAAQALGIASKSLLLEVAKAGKDDDATIALLEQVAERGLSRDDLRKQGRAKGARRRARSKAPVFKFQAPDRSYSVALKFRRSTVERQDLIQALESILDQLRSEASASD